MPRSIPAFGSAELGPFGVAAFATRRPRPAIAAMLSRPAGLLGVALFLVTLIAAVFAPWLGTTDPFALSGAPLMAPNGAHWMGTDALGRDVWSGVLYGARASLFVGAAVGLVAFAFGTAIGMVAGYRPGVMDAALMRVTELFQVVPRFFFVAVVLALFGPGLDRLILTLGLTSWPLLARVVRGEVIVMRQLEFVRAAEALGASERYILVHELLPNVLPGALVLVGGIVGQAMLIEASLGFLGLGDPSVLTWGVLVAQAQGFLRVAWWLALFPGLAILIAVFAFNLLADAFSAASFGG